MANINEIILTQIVQILKECPPNAGINHPIIIGNPKEIKKPNSRRTFFDIFSFIVNLIQIPVSIFHYFQIWADTLCRGFDFGELKYPFRFS